MLPSHLSELVSFSMKPVIPALKASQRNEKKTIDQYPLLLVVKVINKIRANQITSGMHKFIPGIQGWLNIGQSTKVTYHINKIKYQNNMVISLDAQKASM